MLQFAVVSSSSSYSFIKTFGYKSKWDKYCKKKSFKNSSKVAGVVKEAVDYVERERDVYTEMLHIRMNPSFNKKELNLLQLVSQVVGHQDRAG